MIKYKLEQKYKVISCLMFVLSPFNEVVSQSFLINKTIRFQFDLGRLNLASQIGILIWPRHILDTACLANLLPTRFRLHQKFKKQ